MGMSASQGTLLMLTSRANDIELQVQMINRERELLVKREEDLMTLYTDKISNKKLSIRILDANGNKDYVNLTAEELYKAGYKVKIEGQTYDNLADVPEKYRDNDKVGEDNNILQWGIVNGTVTLIKDDKDVSYAGESAIKEEYDESDDAQAKAEYDLEMKKVQNKDKSLQLMLDQLETEHKAVLTEKEAIEKIINKNVEDTYNVFNNG